MIVRCSVCKHDLYRTVVGETPPDRIEELDRSDAEASS